jgi:hypothetical protein
MQTRNYGINGTDINELGQRLPPMQVYGKYEPWGHFAATAARHLDKSRVCELIDRFHHEHRAFPTKYFAPAPISGLRACSFHASPGPCVLDICHDEGPERVE